MSNITTWLNLAETHNIKAPKYILDTSKTLAFSLFTLATPQMKENAWSGVSDKTPVVFAVSLINNGKLQIHNSSKDGKPNPYKVCDESAFLSLMDSLENRVRNVAGKCKKDESYKAAVLEECQDIPDFYVPFGKNRTVKERIMKVLGCNRAMFIPELAVEVFHQQLRCRNAIASFHQIVPEIERITLWSETKNYNERIELLEE